MKIAEGKFIVTGGASLIGSHVAEQLLSQGAREVVLLDNYALGSPDTVKSLLGDKRIKLVRGDILRVNELYDAFEGCDGEGAIRFVVIDDEDACWLGVGSHDRISRASK